MTMILSKSTCPDRVAWCRMHVPNVDRTGATLHEMTEELEFAGPGCLQDRAEGADVITELITLPDGGVEASEVRLELFLSADHIGDPSIVFDVDQAEMLGRALIEGAQRARSWSVPCPPTSTGATS